jgi:hypothetical protein
MDRLSAPARLSANDEGRQLALLTLLWSFYSLGRFGLARSVAFSGELHNLFCDRGN